MLPLARCRWQHVAVGMLSLARCRWHVAVGMLPLAHCRWHVAVGTLPLACCRWHVAVGMLPLAIRIYVDQVLVLMRKFVLSGEIVAVLRKPENDAKQSARTISHPELELEMYDPFFAPRHRLL